MKKIIVLMFFASSLFGYVRLKSGVGVYVYWGSERVPIYYRPGDGGTPDPIIAAVNAWLDQDSYLSFLLVPVAEIYVSPDDSINSVKYVYSADEDEFFSGEPETLAYTITTTADFSGRIVDADIVVGVDRIGSAEADLPYGSDHLGEIVVHEMGHLVGLDHSCEFGAFPGSGIPECGPITNVMAVPIMYPRPLHPDRVNMTSDDLAGLLSIYRNPTRKYKGCGFFGATEMGNGSGNTHSGASNIIIVFMPLLCLFILRRRVLLAWSRNR